MDIKRYDASFAGMWDAFVETSRQNTFLFRRGYMDYHSHRFEDCSLMAFEGGALKALLPANRRGDELFSHQGLTYGGWITPVKGLDGSGMLDVWAAMAAFMRDGGMSRLHYKCVPWIYSSCPADEDRYALFRAGARLDACQLSSAIDLTRPVGFDSNARRNVRRALSLGVRAGADTDFAGFWEVLSGVLSERYDTRPVHTLDEMELLAGRFPENIRLYTARTAEGELLGGVVMYFTGNVAHAQYIAATHRGKASGALPLVFSRVLEDCAAGGWRYLDFGVSCERGGAYLNAGLLRQKSGFGGRGVTYESWTVDF